MKSNNQLISFCSIVVIFFLCVTPFLVSCGSGGGGGGGGGDNSGTSDSTDTTGTSDTDVPDITERTVYTNSEDAMLYSLSTDSNEQFTYFGLRDASGKASSISMVNYVDEDGASYEIFFDEEGLPTRIINEEGASLEFEYISSGNRSSTKNMKSASKDGIRSIDTMGIYVSMIGGGLPIEVRTSVELDEPLAVEPKIPEIRVHDPKGNITVNVTKCGEPYEPDGAVMVNFSRPHSSIVRYPTEATSVPGKYVGWVPQRKPDQVIIESPITAAEIEQMCTAFADKLSDACQVVNPVATGGTALLANPVYQRYLCAEVGAAVSLAATPATGVAAGSLCFALLAGGTLACETVGFGGPTPDNKNVAQTVCREMEEMLHDANTPHLNDMINLQAWADFRGETGIVPGTEYKGLSIGPFPDLIVDDDEMGIDSITTSPSPPVAGKGYRATAELSCALGKDISLEVSRSGWYVAENDMIANIQNPSIWVDVPQASEGTVDYLQVTAEDIFDPSDFISKTVQVKFEEDSEVTATDIELLWHSVTPDEEKKYSFDDSVIQLSGSPGSLQISWKKPPGDNSEVNYISVDCDNCYQAGEERRYYCIDGKEKDVEPSYSEGWTLQYYSVSSPINYGDYSISNFEKCTVNTPKPALPFKSGRRYIVTVSGTYQYDTNVFQEGWTTFGWVAKLAFNVK